MAFGTKRVREKIQGHRCIPANTARAAPRFRGSPIPQAPCPVPTKRTQRPRGPVRTGRVGTHRQVFPQVFRYRQFWPFGGNGHLDPNLRKTGGFWRWHWAPIRLVLCVIWLPQKRRPRGAGWARIDLFPREPCQWPERIRFCLDRPNAMGLRRRSNFHVNEKRAYPATRND
jgi:hypothetical protein